MLVIAKLRVMVTGSENCLQNAANGAPFYLIIRRAKTCIILMWPFYGFEIETPVLNGIEAHTSKTKMSNMTIVL